MIAAAHASVGLLFIFIVLAMLLIAAYLLYIGNYVGAAVGVFLAILVAVFLL